MTTLSPHRRSTPAPPRTSPVHAYTVAGGPEGGGPEGGGVLAILTGARADAVHDASGATLDPRAPLGRLSDGAVA
jgi:hypothetical protein